jgi:hypothetical protein
MNDDVGGVGEKDCVIEIRSLLQEIVTVSGDEGNAERRKKSCPVTGLK